MTDHLWISPGFCARPRKHIRNRNSHTFIAVRCCFFKCWIKWKQMTLNLKHIFTTITERKSAQNQKVKITCCNTWYCTIREKTAMDYGKKSLGKELWILSCNKQSILEFKLNENCPCGLEPAINLYKTNHQLPLPQPTESTNQTSLQLEIKSPLTLGF